MKFMFLLTIDLTKPGPSVHLLNSIIESAVCKKHKVLVLMRDHNGDKSVLHKDNNIEYIFVKDSPVNKNNFVLRFIGEVRYSIKCTQVLRVINDVDAIFLQSNPVAGFFALFLNLFKKTPLLYNVQDIFPDDVLYVKKWSRSNIVYRILKFTQLYAYKNANSLITISEDMKQNMEDSGIPANKIDVVYNWSYSDQKIQIPFSSNKFVSKYRLSGEKFRVLYAGNIGKKQNVDVIIDAARILKSNSNIEFLLVGDGDVDYYKKISQDENLNISFYPLQDSRYAEDVYSCADVIIITLKKGIIYTALPSKTATCLRLDKNIIFCIDIESKFAELISKYSNTYICDCDDSTQLSKLLSSLADKDKKCSDDLAYNFFAENMSCISNPEKYINCLERIAIKK